MILICFHEHFNNFCHNNYIFLGEDEGGPVRTLVFRRSHCNWSKCESVKERESEDVII